MKIRTFAVIAAFVMLLACSAFVPGMAEETESMYEPVNAKKGIYRLKGTDYLVMDYHLYFKPEQTVQQARSFTEIMSQFPDVKTYVYCVTTFRTLDFDHLEEEPPLFTLIRENYPDSETACLEIGSVEEYTDYYYQTDHHWNYKGSYAGYEQIVHMLLGEDEPLMEPVETVEFPVYFNGSTNKELNLKDCKERFTVYRFEYPEMQIKINDKKKSSYGLQKNYFAGKYSTQPFVNHYGQFYGGDVGLIEICTGDESKGNLLVLANSLSNPIDLLLATHFNHTYFVDTRHYSKDMGGLFWLSRAVEKWDIGQVLMLGDGQFFMSGATYR